MSLKETLQQILHNDNSNTLDKSQQIQHAVKETIHFGYDRVEDILQDLYDEIDELKEELHKDNKGNNLQRIGEELGDVLFVLGNLANKYQLNCNDVLFYAVKEYVRRIGYCEDNYQGKFSDIGANDMIKLWQQAKMKK